MKKLLLLSFAIALSAPWTAHAFLTNDDVLAYVAMPLAVSNVCDIRGVQTDQVATLVSYMDRGNVSPAAFVEVFRYVPVALVLNSGRRPDFVQWVGSEVDRGVTGDELVTVMERRLTTYGNVVTAEQFHRYRRYRSPRFYSAAYDRYSPFEPYYVPVAVRRYCETELLDPFALIDMPVAVANVVELGVPIGRVGGLVLQLDLGYVSPLQTVELLRYAPPALLAVNYGQPDFVQYVYDQRVSGLSGFALVQAVDQRLPIYGVTPQIDVASPVYIGGNAWVPSVVRNYVTPVDPAFVPPAVSTQVASFAAGRASFVPQVQRLLDQRGNAAVTNPAQARREIAHVNRANLNGKDHPARSIAARRNVIAPQHARGEGRNHAVGPAMKVERAHPQAMHGPPHVNRQPVMATPRSPQGEHGHGHGGGAPARVVAPAPAAAPAPQGHGNANGQKKGKGKDQ